MDDQTKGYVELGNQTYAMLVDAMAQSQQRSLGYVKNLFEIVSRPYTSTAFETTYRENFDRANQIVALTVNELQAAGKDAAVLAEKMAAQNAAWQESSLTTARGMMKAGVSNLNFVKDTTDAQFESFAKRVEDLQPKTAANGGMKPAAPTTSKN